MAIRKLGDDGRAADLMDQAANTSQVFLEKDIANACAGVAAETHPDFDGKHCVEDHCGVVIPKGRLKLGRIRCVECQERREDKKRRRL